MRCETGVSPVLTSLARARRPCHTHDAFVIHPQPRYPVTPMDPSGNAILDYQAPARQRVFSLRAFLAAAIIQAVLFALLGLIVPRFEPIFQSFGVRLPALTQLLLELSRWFRDVGWIIILPLPFVIGFGVGLLTQAPAADAPRRNWRLASIVILIVGVIVIVTVVALFLPMITLIQAVSGQGK